MPCVELIRPCETFLRQLTDIAAADGGAYAEVYCRIHRDLFLVLTIGLTSIAPGAGVMAPLAIGATLMVMVYAGGHISGAHYNPAVTLAVWLRGQCPTRAVPGYMGAQLVAGSIAAVVVGAIKGPSTVPAFQPLIVPALLIEVLFTFALAYVVLNAATVKATAGNSYFGLAIGFTVVVAAYAGGNISGGSFNPAVALGACIMGLLSWSSIWVHLVADLLGGALAAGAFHLVNRPEMASERPVPAVNQSTSGLASTLADAVNQSTSGLASTVADAVNQSTRGLTSTLADAVNQSKSGLASTLADEVPNVNR